MISIVIPNYNSADLLQKNLPRLLEFLKKSGLEHEVIVVDDCSTDESIEILKQVQDDIKIIKNEKNLGFASTVDRGIRAAKGEIVFTLKTDSLPENSDYFKKMLEHFKNKNIFSITAALKTIESGKTEIRGAGEIYFKKGFFLHKRSQPNLTNLSNLTNSLWTDWPDGSASAFRKDLYLKLGGFDKIYDPFYWEDVDLGFRARKLGYLCVFEPKAILIHEHEEGAINRHYSKEQIKEISSRNQFLFVWKNGNLKQKLLYVLWEPYHDLVAFKNRDLIFFKAYWRAVFRYVYYHYFS